MEEQNGSALVRLAYPFEEWYVARGLGRSTGYQEVASGRLKTYKVGTKRFVTPEADIEWQRAREAETQKVAA